MEPTKGVDDYNAKLESLTSNPKFYELPQKEKGLVIAKLRDEYSAGIEDDSALSTIAALSKSKSDYVKGDRYRVEADDFIKAGLEYPAIAGQPKEKALENIDLFRQQIDERSVYFDPVFRDDYVYDLKRLADEEERAVRGEGVGRAQDLHNRYVKGWTGSLLRGVGMTETADKFDLEFFPVNPAYDADFISKLSTGGGDMVATMGIVLGATAVAGPWAGGAAGLATNATRKYQDAYKQEFDASGNAELAHQAGLASTPGAALETAGEMLVAGRFSKLLPKGFRQEFLKAPNAAARSEVVRKALAETSTRAKLGAIALNSMQEGTSEVAGDFVSGLGSAAVTGRESFVPTGAEAVETFAIGAILGGAMGGVEAGLRRPDAALRGQQEIIKGMLDKGDYEGVSGLARQRIIDTAKPDKDTPTVPEKPQAKPAMSKAEQAVENGEVSNSITNDRGERIKVDERTAKIHDSLIDSLTRLGYVDELNALEPGNKKGQRSNIKTNNDRAVELEAIKAQEDQLNIELPERARLFAEIDKVGEEAVNMDPDKASMVKRLMDAAALTTIQYGMDPNTVYQGMSYRVDQTTEQAKAVARRGKARSIQETFNRESEQLGLDPVSTQVTVTESENELDQNDLSEWKRQEMTASMQLRDSDIFSEEDTGAYHFGDGGIGRDTTFRRMGGGRNTGHFGTGVYFLGNKDNALARADRKSRNIDVSRLNMAKPSVPRTLHNSLQLINKFVYDGKRPEFDQPSSEGRKALFGVNIELGLSKHSEADIQKAIEETYDLFERGENDGVRTPSTYFMQALGYDGIDVRGTDLDNGDYGSVVFTKGLDGNSISSQDQIKLTKAEQEFLSDFDDIDFEEMTDVVGVGRIFSIEDGSLVIENQYKPALISYLERISRELKQDRGKLPPGLHNESLIKKIQNSINADQLNNELQQLPVNGQPYYGRFFHGGSFSGGQIKASKDGSLGAGYYFTTQDRASEYAKISGSTQQEIQGGSVRAFDVLLDKPLVINMDGQPNFVEGLIFEALGMPREKAFEKAEKIIEEKGFISKHFQSIGRKLGYDGIIQLSDGQVFEMVAWDIDSLTDLGNADQLNNELFQKTVQDLWRNLTPAKNAPRTLQVGNSLQSAKQPIEQFLAKNPTVTSKNGRTVQLHHAKQGSIDILVQHLATREDGSFDARRAMHTSRIPHTLQNAEIVATDEKTKNVLYFARYRDKTPGRPGQKSREFDNVHVVLVKPDGTLANHGEITEDIWTQFVRDFADGPANTQGAMPAELLQSMGLVDGSLETSNRSGGDMSVQSLNPTTPTDATSANVGGITTVDGITEQPSTANAASTAPSTLAGATNLADAFSVEVDNNSKLSQSQGENFVKVLFGGTPSKPKGRIQFQNEDGSIAPLNVPIDQLDNKLRSIITISRTSGDVSTFMHETMHYLHRSGILANLLSGQELEAFERAAGLGADRIWRVENYEAVARGFEGWLRNPLVPFEGKIRVPAILERVFRKMSSAMINIYKSLRDSGLPFEDKKGRAVPNIHPDFRVAFERLFSFDPSLRLGQLDIKSTPTSQTGDAAQNASQLASVTRQLTGGGEAVSPQRAPKKATSEQLSAKYSEPDKHERTKEDQLNIKLINGMAAKHRLDNAVLAAFKSVAELSAGLHLDKELSDLFYNILDNFVTSRRINKSSKREQQLREPFAPKIDEGKYSIDFFKPIKDPGDPAYSRQVISRLNQIRDEVFKLWFEQYKARNPKTMGETTVDQFDSKLDVIKFNAENKEKEIDEDAEISARRQSINDNVAIGQLALRERNLEDLPGANLPPKFEPLKAAISRYYEFLKSVDVTTEEMNDRDAFRIQLYLDALLNDDTLLGLADFAKHEMQAKLGEATGLEKYRAAYSKFGLVGILARFGRDISETVTGLRLTSINIEAIARTDSAKRFLNNVLIDDYYDAVTKAQVLKHEYKAFLKATREKHFGKYGTDPIQMHTAGIISKIMQAPIDLDADKLVEAIKNNVAQLRQGFINEAERGGITGKHAGQLKIKLLDSILEGLQPDFNQEQFIDHVQEKFPSETEYVLDNVQWIEDNLAAGSQMVVEGLWATQFNPQGYYLPTSQVSLDPQSGDQIELDGSFFENQYGGDKFKARNPVTVKRSGSLQARTGFLADKERSTYNTNLEYVLEEAVNGIISDIYTGFERKKLGYLLNTSKQTPGSLRAQFEEILSTDGNDGADAVKHLRKTIHDMVATDLGQHRYINQLEALASAIRKNIAPAMLSSLHQPITQTLSAFVSHITRRPKLTQYYVSALKLAMDHTLGNAPASFNVMFERHLSERAPAHDYLLAKGKSIPRTTPLDKLGDYIVGQANIDKKSFTEFRNKAKLFDGAVKDTLLAGLRFGDMFSAKVIFAAELLNAAKQEQGITNPAKVEYDRIKPSSMTEIMNVMDEAINASRNSRRGTILAHPGAVLSMLTIFAGHRISVASATGLRIRNAIELSMDKNFSDGMLGDSAKYALATVFQSIAFSALKWGVMGMLVKGLYQAMTPEEDDERHWLYGGMEREEVEQIRKLTDERYESSFGPNTLGTAILRDMFGNVLLTWAFGGVDNFMFTGMDVPLKENFNQGKEEALDQIRKQLQQRASLLSEAEIEDLNRQYDAIEKMKYVPMGFKSFGSDDFGGSLGAALQPAMDFLSALNESTFTSKRMSAEDFALAMRFFGYGQPELTRILKILAKKKDMDAEREEELNEYDF